MASVEALKTHYSQLRITRHSLWNLEMISKTLSTHQNSAHDIYQVLGNNMVLIINPLERPGTPVTKMKVVRNAS